MHEININQLPVTMLPDETGYPLLCPIDAICKALKTLFLITAFDMDQWLTM